MFTFLHLALEIIVGIGNFLHTHDYMGKYVVAVSDFITVMLSV